MILPSELTAGLKDSTPNKNPKDSNLKMLVLYIFIKY